MMLKELIKRLKEEGRWGYIEDAFLAMQKEITDSMRNGDIKTQADLDKANAQLDILDRCIGLENFKGR